jgi:DNA-binding NarL/FixJ family response regulator
MVQQMAPSAELQVAASATSSNGHGSTYDLVILTADGSTSRARSAISAIARRYPGCRIVAMGGRKSARDSRALQAAGAHSYFPDSLSGSEIRDALRLILDSMTIGKQSVSRKKSEAHSSGLANPLQTQFRLTPRQADVVALACEGKRNAEIAQALDITIGTVKLHMTAAFKALKVENRAQAIRVAANLRSVTARQIMKAESGKLDLDWLLEHMTHQHLPKDTVVFRMGDPAGEFYYLQRGAIRLKELDKDLPIGDVFGEIGIFSPEHRRTSTAVCTTDSEVFKLTSEQVKGLCVMHPEFSFFIVNLITQRLISDRQRA